MSDKIDHIIHVLRQTFGATLKTADLEREYATIDSTLHVPDTEAGGPKIHDCLYALVEVAFPEVGGRQQRNLLTT